MTALHVLEAVAEAQPIGVSELARKLGLPKSSLQRSLETLAAAGWIRPVGSEATRWALTTRMLQIGRAGAGDQQLRTRALLVMEEVRTETRETVHLAVPDGRHVVVIERLESPQPVRTFIPLGMAAPITASANGKAILAHLSADDLEAQLADGLPRFTPATITDRPRFLEQLAQIRQRGYATNEEEWRIGVAAVAAAIL
jgi:IclR family transcriptional regulator, acetate operon repressor